MILNRLFLFKIAVILLVRMWVEMTHNPDRLHTRLVILLVRMWVEIWQRSHIPPLLSVILLVRMWVEMILSGCLNTSRMSFSLWGCELKSAWSTPEPLPAWSSSLWGCELKSLSARLHSALSGHPPCEDVSWNSTCSTLRTSLLVILLVRMWVEISCQPLLLLWLFVILLVRMWVEINRWYIQCAIIGSSSLWGCELKWKIVVVENYRKWSSSLWGCELKYVNQLRKCFVHVILLVRMCVGAITTSHSDSMSGEILAFLSESRRLQLL